MGCAINCLTFMEDPLCPTVGGTGRHDARELSLMGETDRHSRKWFQNALWVPWRCQERWLFRAGVESGNAP